jgi:hypothetical protein
LGSDSHSEWVYLCFPISINAMQALDISGTPTIIAEARDNAGESKITIWRKEKNQQMPESTGNLKLTPNHTGEIIKNMIFLLMLLMTSAFVLQNFTGQITVSCFSNRKFKLVLKHSSTSKLRRAPIAPFQDQSLQSALQ